jgi:tight adherence protein B
MSGLQGAMLSYDDYQLNRWEKWGAILVTGLLLFTAGYLFYQSMIVSLVLSLLGCCAPRFYAAHKRETRKEVLLNQFKQALYSLSTSLAAGKSVENAFRAALSDLLAMYSHSKADIVRELEMIVRRIDHGDTIEHAVLDFSRRTGLRDIVQFSEMFVTCRRTGGDLVDIVRRTSQTIGEKIEMQQEVSIMIARKKFEAKALGIIPPAIIGLLAFGSPEYMEPLYTGGGRMLMTAAFASFVGCFWVMGRMTDIRL